MTPEHEAIVEDWRKNAERHDDRNFRFLRSLKMVRNPDHIDALAHQLHEEAFAKIDCTQCANCCRTMVIMVTDEDMDRIANHLGMTREAFIESYLSLDSEEGGYRMKTIPCPFLGDDGRCTVYEVRPRDCREYPHTDKEEFTSRVYSHSARTLTCPAVFYIVEQMRARRRR